MTQNNKHVIAYDVVRVIATILVVISHGAYIRSMTEYGGVDYSAMASESGFFLSAALLLSRFLYKFHMQLYMALSGALFVGTFGKNNKRFSTFALDKAKRLLIPFFIVSLCYSFPIKYISGYYVDSQNVWTDFLVGQVLLQGNSHLWFLLTLYIIFLLMFVTEKAFPGHSAQKCAVYALLSLLSRFITVHIVSYVLEYVLWFYCGYLIETIRRKNEGILKNKKLLLLSIVLAAASLAVEPLSKGTTLSKILGLLADVFILPLSMCVIIYCISNWIGSSKLIATNLYAWVLRDSLGIYLYSDPLNYLFLFIGISAFSNALFTDRYYWLFYLVRVGGGLILSLCITETLRKLNLKYVI